MKAKVLKVDILAGTVLVGNQDDGTMKEFSLDDFGYTPDNGDYVNIYVSQDGKVFVEREGQSKGYRTVDAVFEEEARDNDVVVNKYVYFVLALLLGMFGVHEFYGGEIQEGKKHLLLCIFLCWTGIVPLVLFVKAVIKGGEVLSMRSDKDGNVVL